MLKRPKPGESEEDLLEFQQQFLAEKTQPSVAVVKRPGDKRRSGSPISSTAVGTVQRDVVHMEDLPPQPPAEAVPPKKKSRFKQSQENAAARKQNTARGSKDPEEILDKHDTHMAVVLTEIIERDTRNMAIQMPQGIGLPFPAVQHLEGTRKKEPEEKKKRSLFAQQFAKSPESFGVSANQQVRSEDHETEIQSVIEGTGLSATFGRDEVRKIHEENVNKLACMSEEEILAEQRKLFETLDPKVVEFLKTKRTKTTEASRTRAETEKMSSVEPVKPGKQEHKESVELPMKVEKSWLHMDRVEYDKLEWMKDLPKPQAGDSQTGQQARFDFQGNLLAPNADIPVNVGLHHHGEEPERAGYTLEELFQLCRSSNNQQRTLALQTLGRVIQQAKEGKLSQLVQTPILPSILDAGVVFLLRWSLDDSVDSVVIAAVAALNALIVNQADELSLAQVFHWPQGHRVPAQCPVPPESPGIRLPDVEDEKGQETDADVAKKDLILALVSRMSLLPRIKYILEVVRPQAPTVIQTLEILVRVARHSAKLAFQIVNFQELLTLIVERFLPICWNISDPSQPLSEVWGVPLSEAMKLMTALCQAGRNMAAILLSHYKLRDRLVRYLAVSDTRTLQLPEVEAYRLQIESLNMWTVCLSYGLADDVYLDIFPSLIQQLKDCHNILEKSRIEQNKLTALVGALRAVLCVAGVTRQQAGFTQDSRPDGSGDAKMSEERSLPLVNWSHVTDLIHPVKLLLRDTLQEVASNYQIKLHCLEIPSVCMDFVTTFYMKSQNRLKGEGAVGYLEDIESVYRLCMSHWKSFGYQTILSGLSKYSNLLQPADLARTEVSSCLPELENSSVSEDSFLPVICRNSPYNFLLSLLRLVVTLSKLHKGLLNIKDISPACFLHCDDVWTYLKKIAPGKPSHLAPNYFTKFENMLQYYILKVATIPAYENEVPSSNRNILHCVALTLLTSLHHGDEHLAHDLLSTVVFSHIFWSDTDTELTSSRLESLSLLDTTPTHLLSATQEEVSFTSDQLCKDAVSKLHSIRATYLGALSGNEKQVMESRNHYLENPEEVQSCLTSHIGECMLPRDWMFLPLIQLYNTFSSVGLDVQNVLEASQVGTVCNVLRWIYLLEVHRPQQLGSISVTLKLSRIMCVYLTGNDLFLDHSVHCFLAGLLRHYTRPKLLDKINFSERIPGLSSFYDLYTGLLQQYEAVSFGDSVFGSYVLIPLQQFHELQYRRAVWTEYSGILRTLSVPIQELLLPVERFLHPEETSVELIRLYYQSLFSETLRPVWSPVLYLMAVHHINRFMYTQDGKHTKLKKTMLSQMLNAKNKELMHHLVYYKQAEVTNKLGMEIYQELPPIRQNYIHSLTHT